MQPMNRIWIVLMAGAMIALLWYIVRTIQG